jgi:hypothetical protein
MKRAFVLAASLVLPILGLPATGLAQEGLPGPDPSGGDAPPKWRIGGFVQNQTGVFVSGDQDAKDAQGSPTNHGGNRGDLSMSRFTLQVEADWQPHRIFGAHLVVRAARSVTVPLDEDAQVPVSGYKGSSDRAKDRRRDWVRDNYYDEIDIRELYVDIQPHPILNIRLGRQLVAWGESGNSRLLDVINPVDATWHFGGFESFEDQRIPLWMLRTTVEIPQLDGGLDVVWIPMLPFVERPEDTVTTPLTFVGAWGLPMPPRQRDESVTPNKIYRKKMRIPHEFGEDSRVGLRWKGNAGPHVNYSLMYYWGHQVSPPIPAFYDTITGQDGLDVYLDFPRQHIAGFSIEGQIPYPLATMLKLEATIEPDRTYPVYSAGAKEMIDTGDPDVFRVAFDRKRKTVVNYGLTLQQPFWVRPLNREEPFVLVFQFNHTIITDFDKDEYILGVPGYDSTVLARNEYRIVGALFSTWLRGHISGKIAAGYIPREVGWKVEKEGQVETWSLRKRPSSHGSGFMTLGMGFKVWAGLRVNVAYNHFFGDEAYSDLGFYRDRDEVNFVVRYQY